MKLSIVVPVLNEAQALPRLLAHLKALARDDCEVLIVDGGSEDGSADIAKDAGFTVLRSARGRARQMNAGAAQTTGEALLFLHADTQLPEGAVALVTQALANEAHHWGRFNVCISGRHVMLPVVAHMMNLRSRWTGIATGDQAMFVSRATFDAVGGFADQPLMEDIELSKRLRKISRPACLTPRVSTSGRRWETHGVWSTILLMWRLRWAYWRGVPASELARIYR